MTHPTPADPFAVITACCCGTPPPAPDLPLPAHVHRHPPVTNADPRARLWELLHGRPADSEGGTPD